jgi:hypothetical protein
VLQRIDFAAVREAPPGWRVPAPLSAGAPSF